MITLNRVNMDAMNGVIADLQTALIGAGQPGDAANLIEDETRRFLKQVIKFVPPKNSGQGRKAIERDINRAMRPLDAEGIFDRRPKLAARIALLKKRRNFAAIQAILRKQRGSWKNWSVLPFTPELHRRARGSRGRIQTSKKVFVLEDVALRRYVAREKSKAGRFKASLAASYIAHGGNVAPWILRHIPSPKQIYFNGLVGLRPTLTVGTASPDARQIEHFAKGALAARREAIQRRIKLIESGYAKDVAAGMRPRRQIKNSPDMEQIQ